MRWSGAMALRTSDGLMRGHPPAIIRRCSSTSPTALHLPVLTGSSWRPVRRPPPDAGRSAKSPVGHAGLDQIDERGRQGKVVAPRWGIVIHREYRPQVFGHIPCQRVTMPSARTVDDHGVVDAADAEPVLALRQRQALHHIAASIMFVQQIAHARSRSIPKLAGHRVTVMVAYERAAPPRLVALDEEDHANAGASPSA